MSNSVLTASPAFGGIDVSWTYPASNPEAVAHVLLYRGIDGTPNGAFQRAVVSGSTFYDKVDADQQYYYWIKFVSVNGTVGDLIGPASATAKPLIADMLEQLTGQIDAGALAQSLKTNIDRITLNEQAITQVQQVAMDGDATLAETLAQIQSHVDDAIAVLQQEVNTRAAADAVQVQAIDTAQAAMGSHVASVQTELQANINTVNGKVTDIGARWTAKVTVDNLVGGFGVYNDGSAVDAGFDVDTFWVGRTQANKRKPFIISGGVVYMDEAAIEKLTFSKLRDQSGNFVVSNGKVQAQYLKVATASIDDAAITSAKIGNAQVDTLRIAGQAVTVPAYVSAGAADLTMNYSLSGEPGVPYTVFILASLVQSFYSDIQLQVNGVPQWTERPLDGTLATRGCTVQLAPGNHTIRLFSTRGDNVNGTSIYALATKR